MRFWKGFRRQAISDLSQLADFVDAQAAFLAQKGIYEYSRARAGHYAKVLFSEGVFLQALEQSRWRAFPLTLAIVAEVVEGILRRGGGERRVILDAFSEVVLSVFDRYPPPSELAKDEWLNARQELAHRLDLIGTHAVKFAKDVPETFAETYFALMPIHEKLRAADQPAIRNYMRVTAINIHSEFEKRADIAALTESLRTLKG